MLTEAKNNMGREKNAFMSWNVSGSLNVVESEN